MTFGKIDSSLEERICIALNPFMQSGLFYHVSSGRSIISSRCVASIYHKQVL